MRIWEDSSLRLRCDASACLATVVLPVGIAPGAPTEELAAAVATNQQDYIAKVATAKGWALDATHEYCPLHVDQVV